MAKSKNLSASAQKVQDALQAQGFSHDVLELPKTTRTAVEAAQAIGCQVGQIVKSLVFRRRASGLPVLVVASGPNRVNQKHIADLISEPIDKPNAEYVRQHTGFSIGGVPPIGHAEALDTFIDEDLFQYDEIWAAAGTPHAVFMLRPADLVAMTAGRVISVK